MSCIPCKYSCENYKYSREDEVDILYRTCEKRNNAPVDDDETCEYDTDGFNPQKEILDYLQSCYSGAVAIEDIDLQLRTKRAIVAFKADTTEDIFTKNIVDDEVR